MTVNMRGSWMQAGCVYVTERSTDMLCLLWTLQGSHGADMTSFLCALCHGRLYRTVMAGALLLGSAQD
jgi:hypothetical protein